MNPDPNQFATLFAAALAIGAIILALITLRVVTGIESWLDRRRHG